MKQKIICTQPQQENRREKSKNKMDLINSRIVDPVKVVTSNHSLDPSPVNKFKKVDDTLKSIRACKNLEEFNKRVKELRHIKMLHRDESLDDKILKRLKSRSKKSFQKEEGEKKKSLHKEQKLKRKSLQLESLNAESFINKGKKNLLNEENQGKKELFTEENKNRKISQTEVKQNKPCLQNGIDQYNEILVSENVNDTQCLNVQTSADNLTQNPEVQIKQEIVNTMIESSDTVEEQLSEQEKSCQIDLTKNQTIQELQDRFSMFPVVKLEKDYTCNVDYPREKIKRHLAVVDSSKSVSGADGQCSGDPPENKKVKQGEAVKKSLSKSEVNSNSSRKKNKKLKSSNGVGKVKKVSKKKHKRVKIKKVVEE